MKKIFDKEIKLNQLYELGEDETLFVIGNGFDLMHGVASSYYDFRHFMSKDNIVSSTMENYIDTDNIWGDFENNLAYLDRERMLLTVDMWLNDFNVLDEDDDNFSAADYFTVLEIVTTPVHILLYELPKEFIKWIRSLNWGGGKSLEVLFNKNFKFINFNYTEFLETIYDIKRDQILYIHGDRRNKNEDVILGHGQDTELVFNKWYEKNKFRKEYQAKLTRKEPIYDRNDNPVYLAYFLKDVSKGNWKSQTRFDAINNIVSIIEDYYDKSAKKTKRVLKENQTYLNNLKDIKNLVVIGHSLSAVDLPYFERILDVNKDSARLNWYFTYNSERSIKKISNFLDIMDINDGNYNIFKV